MEFLQAVVPITQTTTSVAEEAPVPTSAGMLFACWAIVIIFLLVGFSFMRSGKKEYAVAVLPLLLVPLVHIFSGVLAGWLQKPLPLSWLELRVILDLAAGLIGCLLIGLFARQIPNSRTRIAFIWSCTGFVGILTMVLITNILRSV